MYIQDTITMDILNPKETITCRPGAPIYAGPLFTTAPPVLSQATPPPLSPALRTRVLLYPQIVLIIRKPLL